MSCTGNFAAVLAAACALWIPAAVARGQSESAVSQQAVLEQLTTGIAYRAESEKGVPGYERCMLDLCCPSDRKGFATVVWFHGGGLSKGRRELPKALRGRGIAVAGAGYRLHPDVSAPVYIEDAAAAVAWVLKNIESHGGDPKRVIVAGHSAGGYLTLMVGLDSRWLRPHGFSPNDLAGLVPLSGQAITHFTIRKERGIEDTRPIIDDLAPLYHVRKDSPPVLLITGDRNRELLGRYEENAYLWRMFREVKHPDVELLELQGYDHGGMAEPGFPLLLRFVNKVVGGEAR